MLSPPLANLPVAAFPSTPDPSSPTPTRRTAQSAHRHHLLVDSATPKVFPVAPRRGSPRHPSARTSSQRRCQGTSPFVGARHGGKQTRPDRPDHGRVSRSRDAATATRAVSPRALRLMRFPPRRPTQCWYRHGPRWPTRLDLDSHMLPSVRSKVNTSNLFFWSSRQEAMHQPL